jgi:hypothetical protein
MEHRTDRVLVATHIMLLMRVFDLSEGDVLEVGTGYFSTLLLHWLSSITHRHVYSYESKEYWYERAKKYESKYHHIVLCKDWDSADFDKKHWGMVFIDHGPNSRRAVDIPRFANIADYIVIHDTQPDQKHVNLPQDYHYERVWPLFKYRYDYKKVLPWTSVVSNFKELNNIA